MVSSSVPDLDRTADSVKPTNQANVAEPDGNEHPLLIIPPDLSRLDVPFSYRYRGFAKKALRTEIFWTPHRKMMIVPYNVSTVPQPHRKDSEDAAEVLSHICVFIHAVVLGATRRNAMSDR